MLKHRVSESMQRVICISVPCSSMHVPRPPIFSMLIVLSTIRMPGKIWKFVAILQMSGNSPDNQIKLF